MVPQISNRSSEGRLPGAPRQQQGSLPFPRRRRAPTCPYDFHGRRPLGAPCSTRPQPWRDVSAPPIHGVRPPLRLLKQVGNLFLAPSSTGQPPPSLLSPWMRPLCPAPPLPSSLSVASAGSPSLDARHSEQGRPDPCLSVPRTWPYLSIKLLSRPNVPHAASSAPMASSPPGSELLCRPPSPSSRKPPWALVSPTLAPSTDVDLAQQQRRPSLRRARQNGPHVVDLRSVCASSSKPAPLSTSRLAHRSSAKSPN
ncbi:uncharacterized protein [Zea mays]|uniref:Uncharacterized protein n=1 Tax=Zea mays TaxID=4577 RepID=B8A079_MAIZE|nr:uncharacterized protein LOC100279828 isoform X1 [Zea mays]ACL53578.1 unknown [Zea mays]|eukprot:NP_001146254.1 uncharacterized protein LOC100279828 [Zea mays]